MVLFSNELMRTNKTECLRLFAVQFTTAKKRCSSSNDCYIHILPTKIRL